MVFVFMEQVPITAQEFRRRDKTEKPCSLTYTCFNTRPRVMVKISKGEKLKTVPNQH